MSETVHYTGKLIMVPQYLGNSTEEQAKKILSGKGTHTLDSYCKTWTDQLMEDHGDEYVIYNDSLYSVTKKGSDPEEDIYDANKNADGSISFTVRYYNGGCGFGEAIEAALDNMTE